MPHLARCLAPIVALIAFGCSASPPKDAVPPDGTAPAQSASATPPATASSAPDLPAAPTASATAPAVVTADPGKTKGDVPLAHSVSSATGEPAPAASTAVPGAAPTPDELNVIAMCTGKKSMFTDKEAKLLKLADASGDPAMREQAAAIRTRRQDALKEACDRLRAAGKL